MPYKRKKGFTQDAKKVGSKLCISMKKKKISKTVNSRCKPQNGMNFLIDSKCLWKKMKRKDHQKKDSTTNRKDIAPEILEEAKLFQIYSEPDENKLLTKVHNIPNNCIIDCADDSFCKQKKVYGLRAKNITAEISGDVEMSQICAELHKNGWTEKIPDLSEDPIVDKAENSHCDIKECVENITKRIRKDAKFPGADTRTRKRGRPKKAHNLSEATVTNTVENYQYEQMKDEYDVLERIVNKIVNDLEQSQVCSEPHGEGTPKNPSHLSEDFVINIVEDNLSEQLKESGVDKINTAMEVAKLSPATTEPHRRGRPKRAPNLSKNSMIRSYGNQTKQSKDVYDVLERIINKIVNDSKLSRVCTELHEEGTSKNASHLSEDFVLNNVEDNQSELKESDVDKINTTMEITKLCPSFTEPRKRGRPKKVLNLSNNSITRSSGNQAKKIEKYEGSIQNIPSDIVKGPKLSPTPTKHRKRGRPKKVLNLSKDPISDSDGNQSKKIDEYKGSLQNISPDIARGKKLSLTRTKRRKRGRPKKAPNLSKESIVDGTEDNLCKEYVNNNNTVIEIMKEAGLSQSDTKPRKRGRPRKVHEVSECLVIEGAEGDQSEATKQATNLEEYNEGSFTRSRTLMKARQPINDYFQTDSELSADDQISDDEKPMSDVQRKLLEYKDYIDAPSLGKPEASSKLIEAWKEELEEHNQLKCQQKGCGKLLTSLGGMIYHYRICQRKWVCTVCRAAFRVYSSKLLHHMKKHFINGSKVKSIDNPDESSTKDISLNVSDMDKSNSNFIQMEETLSMNSSTSMSPSNPISSVEKKLLKFREHVIFPEIKGKTVSSEELTKKWRKELWLHKKIKCPEKACSVSLSTIGGMIYHYKTACQRKWTCNICDKTFKAYSIKLLKHMRVHFPEPNVPVPIPPKTATQASSFQSHVHAFFSQDFHGIWPEAFKPKKSSWKFLNSNEYENFLPPVRSSMKIACHDSVSKDDAMWFSLPLFESSLEKAHSSHVSFFVGSRVTSSAWCPTKYNFEAAQYICIAMSGTSPNCRNSDDDNRDGKGLLQLWNIGNLQTSSLDQSPVLSLAIAHTHGPVRAMVWCPQGCWEDPFEATNNSTDFMPRLGIIAVTCPDSFIRLYSIPHPQALECVSSNLPICTTNPVLILRPRNGMPFTQRLECTAVSWHRSDDSKIIVGGYSNGFICLFDISSHSSTTSPYVYPYSVFLAHSATVTSIAFGPLHSQWIATMSSDKKVKVWNLEDTNWPVRECKQAFGKSLNWSLLWPGVFGSFDGLETRSTSLLEFSCFRRFRKMCSNANSSQWAQSVSEWLNTIVLGDGFGSVTISTLYKYKHSHFSHCFHVFNTEVIALAEKDDVSSSQESESKHQYGLRFVDYNLKDAHAIPKRSSEKSGNDQTSCFDGFHLAAIDTVQWNPNFGSHSWIFSVGHSGIVRLIHIPELQQIKNHNLLANSSLEE